MKTILRNLIAVILGMVVGGLVNMALVMTGPKLIPPPAGVNMSDAQSLSASVHLLEPRHYVFPFLAHALGTLAGAWLTATIAASHRALLGYVIGGLFLAGGIAAACMIAAPIWFVALDLVAAYLPMAWLGVRLAGNRRER